MPNTENEAFLREQQQAVERMMEMSRRSVRSNPHPMPPTPSFVRLPESENQNLTRNSAPTQTPAPDTKQNQTSRHQHPFGANQPQRGNGNGSRSLLSGLLPKQFSFDGDTALILGLILLLSQENTDRMLLYALVYILL